MKNSIALIIAGSDSCSGAGMQADLKTFTVHNVYASTVLTALTAQNTLGVNEVFNIPSNFIETQIKALAQDFNISFIKIGMLSNVEIIETIDNCLSKYLRDIPIVLDPVMIAKGGHNLIEENAVDYLVKKLLPKCFLLTPNIPEAEKILNCELTSINKVEENIKNFHDLGVKNILLKGGHLKSNDNILVDTLCQSQKISKFYSKFINTKNTHGTGCSLASAITSNLMKKQDLNESVINAQKFVYESIKNSFVIGAGHNPINHLYKYNK